MPSSPPSSKFAPEASLSLLRSCLRRGLHATPLCLAIIAWLCDVSTDPRVAEIRSHHDVQVWLRLSGEPSLAPLCSHQEFLGQVRIVCQSVGVTVGQTRAMVAWAGRKLA